MKSASSIESPHSAGVGSGNATTTTSPQSLASSPVIIRIYSRRGCGRDVETIEPDLMIAGRG